MTKSYRLTITSSLSRKLQYLLLANMFVLVSCLLGRVSSVSAPTALTNTATSQSTSLPTTIPVPTSTPTLFSIDRREKFSPGLYLAYWSQSTWRVRDVGGSRSMPLLPDIKSDFYTEIEVSPDGNKVVFASTPGQVSIYDFRTGMLATYPNTEVNYAHSFTWLSNGNVLLYLGTIEEAELPDARVAVYGISLLKGITFKIVDWTDDRFQYGLHDISLSKDEQWLAFDASRISELYMAEHLDFAVYMLETACLERLQTCGESIQLVGDGRYPEWSPDGRLGWVCPQGTRSALCVAEVDSLESPQVFLTVGTLGKSADAKFYGFAWSPDGKYAAIAIEQDKPNDPDHERSEIFLIPADGSKPVRVTAAADENEYLEGWSPDSRYLVYSQVLGYTEPQGELGGRALITDLYLYDVETRTKQDFIDMPGDREVFGFFMNVK